MSFVQEMISHAESERPREACGLVVKCGSRHRLIRARNLHEDPNQGFRLDPEAWLEVGESEAVIGIYHSHTKGSPDPSMPDLVSCEASRLPWHIVSVPDGEYRYVEPKGFEAPYTERPYAMGVLDCYTVMRDWYMREWNLELPDFDRKPFVDGENMYETNYGPCGFVRQFDQRFQAGDMLLFQVGRSTLPHAAVCVSEKHILHHPQGRLSLIESVDGFWNRFMTHHLRHKSRIDHG